MPRPYPAFDGGATVAMATKPGIADHAAFAPAYCEDNDRPNNRQ